MSKIKNGFNIVCLKVTKMNLSFRVPTVQSSARNATECEKQKSLEMEEKLAKLLEMFPQRNRSELLEVTVFLLLTQFLKKDIFVALCVYSIICTWYYLIQLCDLHKNRIWQGSWEWHEVVTVQVVMLFAKKSFPE